METQFNEVFSTMHPYMIGIAGASGSGKTTFAKYLSERLKLQESAVISVDSYYRDRPELSFTQRNNVNYDEPQAIDKPLLTAHLVRLSKGLPINQPVYDFLQHGRITTTKRVAPRGCVIVEGNLLFLWSDLCALFNTKLFIIIDGSTAFKRRLVRDTKYRGRSPQSVRTQWTETVEPMWTRFVEPTHLIADIVLDGSSSLQENGETVLNHLRHDCQSNVFPDSV